jgi:hypothetical protein
LRTLKTEALWPNLTQCLIVGPFRPRRRLRRRVLIFSGMSGAASVLAGAIVLFVADVYQPAGRMAETNAQTLLRIRCDAQTCDMSDINGDPEFEASDYILDKRNYFFLAGLYKIQIGSSASDVKLWLRSR